MPIPGSVALGAEAPTSVKERMESLSALRPASAVAAADLRIEACETVDHVAHLIERCRKDLAFIYARVVGGTPVEHEIGECLTLTRKAEKRLLEAYTELAQQELPLE